MVLKLVGSPFSTCTARVATVLHEKKIPYELVPVDFRKSEHKTPDFLALQPFGQVPYIVEEDGFVLYESRAICRYIAAKYANQGTKLIPETSDLKATALFEQAASIELSNFDPFASKAGFEAVIKKAKGLVTDQAALDAAVTALDAKLDVYEIILHRQTVSSWVAAGNDFLSDCGYQLEGCWEPSPCQNYYQMALACFQRRL